jgi:hypothetical protein
MTTDDFSLRALVRDVKESSTLVDPGLIATEVDKRIGDEELRLALRQALRTFVRQVITEDRTRTQIAPFTPGGPSGAPSSWKVREVQAYQRALRDPVHVGQSQWKALGDCTAVDLAFAAVERDEQAQRNAAKARQYREAKRLLDEHEVDRVRDLPPEVLSRVLVNAA